MGKTLVKDVYDYIDSFAPFATQMDFDNSGLLCGSMGNEVNGIVCALDLTPEVINEAVETGANLIVTHHPILFRGRKNLTEEDCEGRMLCALVRNNINLIAAHTNYDMAEGGVNDVLADMLGLKNITPLTDGLLRAGEITPCTLEAFIEHVKAVLGDSVRAYGSPEKQIKRVAVCGGSAGEYACEALSFGADAYLTGEMRYHDSLNLAMEGFATLECGHDATEKPAVSAMAKRLERFGIRVCVSKTDNLSATKQ